MKMKKLFLGLALAGFLMGSGMAEAKDVVSSNVLLAKYDISPLFYAKLKVRANLRKNPDLLRKSIVARGRKGDIYPVIKILHNRWGIWYQVGDNLYIHYSVAEKISWL
jgi:hypothetical protein